MPQAGENKERITLMEEASKALFALKPLTFRYKNDPTIAQQHKDFETAITKLRKDMKLSSLAFKSRTEEFRNERSSRDEQHRPANGCD